jgi:hypothetical protein
MIGDAEVSGRNSEHDHLANRARRLAIEDLEKRRPLNVSRSSLPLVKRSIVRLLIEAVYRAEKVRVTHEHLESNRAVGKIVLTFS